MFVNISVNSQLISHIKRFGLSMFKNPSYHIRQPITEHEDDGVVWCGMLWGGGGWDGVGRCGALRGVL